MKQIKILGNNLKLQKCLYPLVEIDTLTLSKRYACDKNNNQIKNDQGVYIFVSNKTLPKFNKKYFNSEVTGVFFKKNSPYIKEMEIPPFNSPPKKDCIFYVGSDTHIISRVKEHWNKDKLNGCTSLKLGFTTRKWIKSILRVYVIHTQDLTIDYKSLEIEIRNEYGTAFGK